MSLSSTGWRTLPSRGERRHYRLDDVRARYAAILRVLEAVAPPPPVAHLGGVVQAVESDADRLNAAEVARVR